jgi:predicted anti-sigma-YlaC factor YlaD
MMNEYSCGIIRDLLPLYYDNVCSKESRQAVEEHLHTCPACQKELQKLTNDLIIPEKKCQTEEEKKVMEFSSFLRSFREKSYRKGLYIGIITALLLTVITFYLFPLLIVDTGSGMFALLLLIPAFCFLTAFLFGLLAGIQWLYPLLIAVLFLPTIWIYYNSSAWIYVIPYTILALVGNLTGGLIRKFVLKHKSRP